MKLAHIFENTERGSSGGNNAPGSMSYDQAFEKLNAHANNEDFFIFDDVETKDAFDIIALVQTGHIDSQKPTTMSPHRAETPEDLHGSFEVEWNIVSYAKSMDEDGEIWTVHEFDSEPDELTNAGEKHIDDDIHEKVGNQEPEHPDY